MSFEYRQIGVLHTPWERLENMPIQPAGAAGVRGEAEVFEEYRQGLQDLDGFSHIVLLYHFHRSRDFELLVVPYMDTKLHGVFATRAPRRPNPIGLSVVELVGVEDGTLHLGNVDMLDGTPLLDIKPYVPEFDGHTTVRTGWLEAARRTVGGRRSDGRFAGSSQAGPEPSRSRR